MKLTLFWLPSPRLKKLARGALVGTLVGLLFIAVAWAAGLGHQESYVAHDNSLPVSTPDIAQKMETSLAPNLQGEDYFVNYRLERERYRQETKGMIQVLLNSADSKSRAQAQARWLEISTQFEYEGEIENLLKIKGFQDVVVNYSPNGAHVILYAQELGKNEIGLVQEIVQRVSHLRLNQIIISTRT